MGQGIDFAAMDNPEHAKALDNLKDQLLIVFTKRLRNKYKDDLVFSVAEVDDTGSDLFAFRIDPKTLHFHFTLMKQS